MKKLLLLLALALSASQASAAPTKGKTFGDWQQACNKLNGIERCYVFQQLKHKKTKETIVHASIGYPPGKDTLMLFFTVPCGVSLPHGMGLELGKSKPMRWRYRTCRKDGCLTGRYLAKDLRKQLVSAKEIHVLFANVSNRAFRIKVSGKGLKQALTAMDKLKPKLPPAPKKK